MVRETLVRDALDRLAALLPASWRLNERAGGSADHRGVDAVVDLVGPDGAKVSFVVEARRAGSVPTSVLVPALGELQRASGPRVLFVSDYIGPALREALTADGISFVDATGWVRVTAEDPLVFLTGQGSPRSPRVPQATAVRRLNGLAASRIVRALATANPPLGVRALASLADVSPGSVSKLLATLAAEGIVDRDGNGAVVSVRRRALLRRWVVDYSFLKTNRSVGYFIAPRGLEGALDRLSEQGRVAITGSAAARRLLPESSTPVVPMRLLAVYAANPANLARELGLIDADPATANVVIARPQDADILEAPDQRGLVIAPTALVIADLLTLPGRSDAEAEQLMDALAAADQAWKE